MTTNASDDELKGRYGWLSSVTKVIVNEDSIVHWFTSNKHVRPKRVFKIDPEVDGDPGVVEATPVPIPSPSDFSREQKAYPLHISPKRFIVEEFEETGPTRGDIRDELTENINDKPDDGRVREQYEEHMEAYQNKIRNHLKDEMDLLEWVGSPYENEHKYVVVGYK